MAQPKPDRKSVDEILELVNQLSPEEHDQLVAQMKLPWLQRAVQQGDEAIAAGELYSLDELNARLDRIDDKLSDGRDR